MIYREESERVSELKNVSGSGKLPYGTLALGAEGIKEAITSFDDAYVTPNHIAAIFDKLYVDANPISKTNVSLLSWLIPRMPPHIFQAPAHLWTR